MEAVGVVMKMDKETLISLSDWLELFAKCGIKGCPTCYTVYVWEDGKRAKKHKLGRCKKHGLNHGKKYKSCVVGKGVRSNHG